MKVLLLLVILVCGTLSITPDESYLSKTLFRKKRNSEDSEYLEQCGIVDAWREQPGFVNVLAFLDPYWQLSHRQAIMLKLLKDRLERSEISDVRFFVVISAHPGVESNNAESADEIEAWAGAAPNESLGFSGLEQSVEAIRNETRSDIPLVQDTKELRIWERLQASRDQIFVIDRCGRLSYQVIVPWSILHFPYVKAAILSTYMDQPCGECDLQPVTEPTAVGNSQTERLPEILSHALNVTRMKEIAEEKYNLDHQFEKVQKPQHQHIQFEDLPDNIMKLLNQTIGIKHDNISLDHNNKEIEEIIGEVQETTEQRTNNNHNNMSHQVNTGTKETQVFTEIESNHSEKDIVNSTESQLPHNNSSHQSQQQHGTNEDNTRHNENKNEQTQTNARMLSNQDKLDENDRLNILKEFAVDPEDSLEMYKIIQNENKEDWYVQRKDGNGKAYAAESIDNLSQSTGSPFSSSLESPENEIVRTALNSDEVAEKKWSTNSDYLTPIRIIMHAPHVHDYGYLIKKHEYLVLRTGQPDYHDHLDSGEVVKTIAGISAFSVKDDENEGNDDEAESTTLKVDEKNENDEYFNRTDNKKELHSHYMGYHANKFGGEVYGRDESPGFYGEDSEYWRNDGNEEYHGKFEDTRPNADGHYTKIDNSGKQTEFEIERFYGHRENSSIIVDSDGQDQSTGSMIGRTEGREKIAEMGGDIVESIEEVVQNNNLEVNEQSTEDTAEEEEEEEIKTKLIAHYSKLLPWISYVLEE